MLLLEGCTFFFFPCSWRILSHPLFLEDAYMAFFEEEALM